MNTYVPFRLTRTSKRRRAAPTTQARTRPITPADLATARRVGAALRERLAADARGDNVQRIAELCNNDPYTMAALLRSKYAMSTAATYFNVATARRCFSREATEGLAWKRLRTEMNKDIVVQKAPLAELRSFRPLLNTPVGPTIALMLLSASRHDDLAALRLHRYHRLPATEVLQFKFGASKGDRTGRCNNYKTIEAAPHLIALCLQGYRSPATYAATEAMLKHIGLTTHSCRHSVTTLLHQRFTTEEVSQQTCHARKDDKLSTAGYTEPEITHARARLQRRMSLMIAQSLMH